LDGADPVPGLYISSNITSTHNHTSASVLVIILPKGYVLADLLVAITCEELQWFYYVLFD
jgi:hypothetical protein